MLDDAVAGRSFTFDDRYPRALKRLLQQHAPGTEVVNAGHVGETIDHEVVVFREVGRRLRPDVVVLQFFANDIQDLAERDERRRIFAGIPEFPLKRHVRRTATYQLLVDQAVRITARLEGNNSVVDAAQWWHRLPAFYRIPLDPAYASAWREYATHFDQLVADVRAMDARLLVLVVPDWYQVTRAAWEPVPQQMMASVAARHDVPVVDVLDVFRATERPESSLYGDPDTDGHLNDRGNALIARMVFTELVRRGWVEGCHSE
jgi:lysophospholipase L1-like esterase